MISTKMLVVGTFRLLPIWLTCFIITHIGNWDIGDWNVCFMTLISTPNNMTQMFYGTNFLQDLSDWTLPLVPYQHLNFHTNSSAWNNFVIGRETSMGAPCASPSIAASDQTDWNTNSTIEGQGNALNLADGNGISIYPNPTTGIINLDPVPEGTYRLYNEIGRLIDQGKIQPRFDLSNFDNGIYMLLLQTANESKYFIVIKQ